MTKNFDRKNVICFVDFLAFPGAPGGPRTKNSENYFYIFLRNPGNWNPANRNPGGDRDPGFRNLE